MGRESVEESGFRDYDEVWIVFPLVTAFPPLSSTWTCTSYKAGIGHRRLIVEQEAYSPLLSEPSPSAPSHHCFSKSILLFDAATPAGQGCTEQD